MHIRITLPTSRRIRTLKGTNTHAAIKLLDRILERPAGRWAGALAYADCARNSRRRPLQVTPKAAARTSTALMVHSGDDRRSDHILNDRFCGWDGHANAGGLHTIPGGRHCHRHYALDGAQYTTHGDGTQASTRSNQGIRPSRLQHTAIGLAHGSPPCADATYV
jgi:hypothetical protein